MKRKILTLAEEGKKGREEQGLFDVSCPSCSSIGVAVVVIV